MSYTLPGFLNERSMRTHCGCVLWMGACTGAGYGSVNHGGRALATHRASYEYAHGPIPEGQLIRHKCDVPACINPEHLVAGTFLDNMRDRSERGRAPVGESNKNHKLTKEIVLSIRADRRSIRKAAKAYGVTTKTIQSIRGRKTWRHVL